jgi:hypothetical protein
VDPTQLLEAGNCSIDVPIAQVGEERPLARVVLSAVVGQGHRRQGASEFGKGAAGFDLGKLAVVADEHELGAGLAAVLDEPGELARAHHSRLVHDLHRAGVGRPVAPVDLAEQAVDGRRRHAGRLSEALCRSGGERATHRLVSSTLAIDPRRGASHGSCPTRPRPPPPRPRCRRR